MVDDMGIFRTTIGVASIARPAEPRNVEVMVDTGSEYNWLPRPLLNDLGVDPQDAERFETADGRVLERQIGMAVLHLAGRVRASTVVFAEPGDVILLGAIGLEAFNLRVDLAARRLVPAGPVPVAGMLAA